MIFSISLIGLPLAFAGTYLAPPETTTPIVSTRGHIEETDGVNKVTSNPSLTLGHTDTDYDTTGNIPGLDNNSPKEIVIYVHGFNSDETEAVFGFNTLKKSLEKNDYLHPVIGFSWDSKTGLFDFDDAKFIATLNGKKLGQFIFDFKCKNPDTAIHLVGHSLGTRVILNTLQTLYEDEQWSQCKCGNGQITSVHVLGAAVDDDEVAKTDGFGNAIENIVGEFHNKYSSEDDILSVLYVLEEGSQSLGEEGAQIGIDLPENYHQEDVTEEVGYDHSGYIRHSDDSDAIDPENDGIVDNITNDWKNQKQEIRSCVIQDSSKLDSFDTVDSNISQNQTNGKEPQQIQIGKQIQIVSDVTNKQDRVQPFAYIVQIQNEDGVTVSLGWLTGELNPFQSMSPALSWIPEDAGIYTATIFVWEGIDQPLALSYPLEMTLNVGQSS